MLMPIVMLLFVSFAVYFNALLGDFVYDDTIQILENPWIKDITNIPAIFSKSVWSFKAGPVISNYYRPLMHIANMFSYYLFSLKPWGFHLVNVLFHCSVSVLVFLIIRRLLAGQNSSQLSIYHSPPLIAALLFASHPIHTEAVTWIAGLPDVAFAFFYLCALYLYTRAEAVRSGWYLGSLLCFTVAAFFKEPALTLPVILFAYDSLFCQGNRGVADYARRYIPYVGIGLGYLALRMHALGAFAPSKRHVILTTYQYEVAGLAVLTTVILIIHGE